MPARKGIPRRLFWGVTIGLVCLGVGLPLYLVKQNQVSKEKARLELEAKCSAYESELNVLVKRFHRLSSKGSALAKQAQGGEVQKSIILPSFQDNLISMDEVSDKTDAVADAFQRDCGKERSMRWWKGGYNEAKAEAEALIN